jgi:hypothetical protein
MFDSTADFDTADAGGSLDPSLAGIPGGGAFEKFKLGPCLVRSHEAVSLGMEASRLVYAPQW